MSITKLFAGLSGNKKQVQLPYSSMHETFDLGNPEYIDLPEMHGIVRFTVGTSDYLRGPHYGPTKAYFSDPTKTLLIEADPGPFYNGYDTPENTKDFPSSSAIIYATHETWNKKNEMALIIRETMTDIDQDAIIFALRGVQNEDKSFTIKKIMVPQYNKDNQRKKLKTIPLTTENIARAMIYAERCKEQIQNKAPVTALANLQYAGSADWSPPTPKP